jgi:hypothetical protein
MIHDRTKYECKARWSFFEARRQMKLRPRSLDTLAGPAEHIENGSGEDHEDCTVKF